MCAYCAGVTLTLFLRISAFGGRAARLLRCDKNPVSPGPYFPFAFLGVPLFSILVSAISSCLWIRLTVFFVGKVYGNRQPA